MALFNYQANKTEVKNLKILLETYIEIEKFTFKLCCSCVDTCDPGLLTKYRSLYPLLHPKGFLV